MQPYLRYQSGVPTVIPAYTAVEFWWVSPFLRARGRQQRRSDRASLTLRARPVPRGEEQCEACGDYNQSAQNPMFVCDHADEKCSWGWHRACLQRNHLPCPSSSDAAGDRFFCSEHSSVRGRPQILLPNAQLAGTLQAAAPGAVSMSRH